jgi:hypothetical protein
MKGIFVEYWLVNILARMKLVDWRMYYTVADEVGMFANHNEPFEA